MIILSWRPHPILMGHEIAKYKGFSVVKGPFISGNEVMLPDGEVASGFSEVEVVELIREHYEHNK